MLKREITYTTFDEEEVSEIFYFHMGKPELIEMEVEFDGGLGATLERIVEEKNHKRLIEMFKRLVLASYGEKSQDGKHFVKSPEIALAFSQTAAYEALFMELATDDNAAVKFISGILPSDLGKQVESAGQKSGMVAVAQPPHPPR